MKVAWAPHPLCILLSIDYEESLHVIYYFCYYWYCTQSEKVFHVIMSKMKQQGLVNVKSLDPSIAVLSSILRLTILLKGCIWLYDGLLFTKASSNAGKANAIWKHPNYRLLVYDGGRPLRFKNSFGIVFPNTRRTSAKTHGASPSQKSIHNYGRAKLIWRLPLSKASTPDMGTPFDFFGKLASIQVT